MGLLTDAQFRFMPPRHRKSTTCRGVQVVDFEGNSSV
jgi:hypothetical protein